MRSGVNCRGTNHLYCGFWKATSAKGSTYCRRNTKAYDALANRFRRVAILRSIAGTLSFDAATVMPAGARNVRGEQLSMVEEIANEVLKATETRDLIDQAFENQDALDPWQRANLREIDREAIHSSAVPGELAAT